MYFRIISNYEYSKGDFLTTQAILEDAKRINQPINEVFLGRTLKRIWGEKIENSHPISKEGSGYKNLAKRLINNTFKTRNRAF